MNAFQKTYVNWVKFNQSLNLRSDEEFAHEDSERPIVDGPVVALVEDDLGCDVLWSSAKRPGSTSLGHELGKPEIDLKKYWKKL